MSTEKQYIEVIDDTTVAITRAEQPNGYLVEITGREPALFTGTDAMQEALVHANTALRNEWVNSMWTECLPYIEPEHLDAHLTNR